MKTIVGTVGQNGNNNPDDVFMIQMLLNHVPPQSGGPTPSLNVDGIVGPKTIAAIQVFQQKQLGFSDGIVEPNKNTLARLNEYFDPPSAFADSDSNDFVVASNSDITQSTTPIHRLVYRDVRLEGMKPGGDTVIEVNFDTPLQWFINSSLDTAAKQANNIRLKIMAHGYPPVAKSQGGGGMLFCTENIDLNSIVRFHTLYGKFLAGVDLYSCGIAFITPGYEGKIGDGNLLCSQMAQILGTCVRASTAIQWYQPLGTNGIDFGQWEGTVLTYGPKGNVVDVQHAPKF